MALFEEPGEELNETPFRSREQRVVYESPIDLIRQRGSSMVASFFDRTLTPAARQLDLLENENEDEDPPAEESEEEDPEEESDRNSDDDSDDQNPPEDPEDPGDPEDPEEPE